MKKAFTLAEVLITLGIIGIVAAMTMPVLIGNYQQQVIETKLKRVYSVMNQAIKLSEVDNGDAKYWPMTLRPIEFYNKYYKNYLKVTGIEELGESEDDGILIYFADGSVLKSYRQGRDYNFFIDYKKYKQNKTTLLLGKDVFSFRFAPNDLSSKNKYHQNRGFESYKYDWNGTEEDLYNGWIGCNKNISYNGRQSDFCTALIQYHNWKIPDNYPIKF